MKIAFDVDVLAKQGMSIKEMVYQVADWGYKYIEQSPHPKINWFFRHPKFSLQTEQEYRQALKDTGVEISSFICVYRWSGPSEELRQASVKYWKRLMQIAVNMGVEVINTELSGDPHQPELCEAMLYKSLDELVPLAEKEGIRIEIQAHPYDFCELNDETVEIARSYRSDNLKYIHSTPHAFYYDEGKGDVRHQLEYAGEDLSHVLFADTWNHTKDCRYIVNPPGVDAAVHSHLHMGEGEIDFDEVFATLRDMDFKNFEFKVGGPPISCVSYFGYPEKMAKQAIEARERIERELL